MCCMPATSCVIIVSPHLLLWDISSLGFGENMPRATYPIFTRRTTNVENHEQARAYSVTTRTFLSKTGEGGEGGEGGGRRGPQSGSDEAQIEDPEIHYRVVKVDHASLTLGGNVLSGTDEEAARSRAASHQGQVSNETELRRSVTVAFCYRSSRVGPRVLLFSTFSLKIAPT